MNFFAPQAESEDFHQSSSAGSHPATISCMSTCAHNFWGRLHVCQMGGPSERARE